MNRFLFYFLFILFSILSSCQIIKKVPEKEYLLTKNIFVINGKKKFSSKLTQQLEQTPNDKIMGIPFSLMMYNLTDSKLEKIFETNLPLSNSGDKKKAFLDKLKREGLEAYLKKNLWVEKFLYKHGQKPILLDKKLSNQSIKNINHYYISKGYLDASTKLDFFLKNKKAKLIYSIHTGAPYKIASIKYEFDDLELEKIYLENKKNSFLKVNEIYDEEFLEKESEFLEELFRNNGYYKFKAKGACLSFEVNFIKQTNKVHLFLKVAEKNKIEEKDELKGQEKNKKEHAIKFYLGNITLNLEDHPNTTLGSKKQYTYKDRNIKFSEFSNYKPKRFAKFISISSGDLYRENEIEDVKKKLYGLENFHLSFNESTNKNFINLDIYLRPLEKYELQFSLEGSTSRHFDLGITPGIRILRRNIFGGAENLDLSLMGTFASIKKVTPSNFFFNALETSFQGGMKFPYFLTPFKLSPLGGKYLPSTSILFRVNAQHNIGIGRVVLSNNLNYNWNSSSYTSHQLSILGIQLVQNFEKSKYFNFYLNDRAIREKFINFLDQKNQTQIDKSISENELLEKAKQVSASLEDQEKEPFTNYLRMNNRYNRITQDDLITSLSYLYLYDGKEKETHKNPWFFMGRVESLGNFLSLFRKSSLFEKRSKATNDSTYYLLKRVPYSQFIKIDLDVRKYWIFSPFNKMIVRAFLGVGIPYGNSNSLPFIKSYFAGGPNDIRAWMAYDLGPGSAKNELQDLSFSDLKFTLNAEFRFKIISDFLGAIFLDAGNIWSIKGKNEETFFLNQFYKQLVVGGGLGIRWNLNYFVLRADFGYKIYDPSKVENKWILKESIKKFPTLNLGVDYPF